jgi:hypothetical protein
MNRFKQFGYILPLLLIAACGGGSKSTPPPALNAATDAESLKTLKTLAQNAIDACCRQASVYMVNYGAAAYATNPYAGQVEAAANAQPQMDDCNTAVMNFELQFRTTANGTYASYPPAAKWRQEQGRAVINCVGGNMQSAGLPISPSSWANYAPAISVMQNQFSGVLGQNSIPNYNIPTNAAPINRGLASNPYSGAVYPYANGAANTGAGINPYANYGGLGNNVYYPFPTNTQVLPYVPLIPATY